ncbi:WD repeat, SAM and U-box domain-containing protein 1 [Chytriomyces hyalinus]|nr:WD repeat, SAM and U-box domain-containing protein 1 [Chytriomyces hyalinus]
MTHGLKGATYSHLSNGKPPTVRDILSAIQKLSRALECPLSHETFKDPVVAADGRTYDRQNLAAWFASQGRYTSPITREPLSSELQLKNLALVDVIRAYSQLEDAMDDGSIFSKSNAGSLVEQVEQGLDRGLKERVAGVAEQLRESQDALVALENARWSAKQSYASLVEEIAAKDDALHEQALKLENAVSKAEKDTRAHEARVQELKIDKKKIQNETGDGVAEKQRRFDKVKSQIAFWERVQKSPVESFMLFLASLWFSVMRIISMSTGGGKRGRQMARDA